MGIAGFASNTREPFATDMAAEAIKALPHYTDDQALSWVEALFWGRLRLLSMINNVEGGPQDLLDSYVITARISDDNIPQVTKFSFKVNQKAGHPEISTFADAQFHCVRSGVTTLVDSVVDGTYSGHNPNLRSLQSTLRHHRQDDLSIEQMTRIASALIRETASISFRVGGPTQIGVFEVNKESVWRQPNFSPGRSTLGMFDFHENDLKWGIYLTQVTPRCCIAVDGGLSAGSDRVRGPFR
jgi:hypothetical protein